MMGPRQKCEPKLFYPGMDLETRIPPDHPLRRIKTTVDFDFVRPLVKPRYGHNGKPSLDPVVVLKLMFLLFDENVPSERALLARLPMRLDWLWFCGYGLEDSAPDHSVLSKARRRWGKAAFETFFQRILEQCIEAGLVDGRVVYLDSSMIAGNASKDQLRVHLRRVGGQMYDHLEAAEDLGGDRSNAAKASGPGPDLGRPKDAPEDKVLAGSDGSSAPILAKEGENSPGPEGSVSEGSEGPAEGEDPLRPGQRYTPVDPDARLGRKYGQTTLGYKDHRVVEDRSGIITATVTSPANVNDETMLRTVIEEHESNTGSAVAVAGADRAYGTGENYRYLRENDITPCIPHRTKNCNRDSDLDNRWFAYEETTDTFRCPAGQTLNRRQVATEKNAVIYEAPREVCEKCIHFARCVSSRTRGRRISRNLHEPDIDWADGCLSRAERKRLMARRKAKVEGSFADAANNHGFKRARWRGLERVRIQNLLIAAVQNLRKLLRTGFGKRRTSAAEGILKGTSASFSSLGIFVRDRFGNFLVASAGRTNFTVLRGNTTPTDPMGESIFDPADY